MIRLIYASDLNGCIGVNNTLPWRLPSDLKRFRNKTKGGTVLMGKNTYDSLPENCKPLSGRTNIVISSTLGYPGKTTSILENGVIVVNNLESYLLSLLILEDQLNEPFDVWIIGGASIYKQAIQYADEVHHTRILTEVEGDTYFNIKDYSDFILSSSEIYNEEEDYPLSYTLDIYVRKGKNKNVSI